jgi:uncharacterized membrane protein YvlD (DUF360 family)
MFALAIFGIIRINLNERVTFGAFHFIVTSIMFDLTSAFSAPNSSTAA